MWIRPRAVSLFLAITCTVSAQTVRSRPLTPSELAIAKPKLNTALIPKYNNKLGDLSFNVEGQQAFAVTGARALSLWLIPVIYEVNGWYESTTAGPRVCGLYTLRPDGGVSFVKTYGDDEEWHGECSSTQAVGFVSLKSEQFPLVIVLTRGQFKPSMMEWEPASDMRVLQWDPHTKGYVEDKDIEAKLDRGQYPDHTIAQVRRAILSVSKVSK